MDEGGSTPSCIGGEQGQTGCGCGERISALEDKVNMLQKQLERVLCMRDFGVGKEEGVVIKGGRAERLKLTELNDDVLLHIFSFLAAPSGYASAAGNATKKALKQKKRSSNKNERWGGDGVAEEDQREWKEALWTCRSFLCVCQRFHQLRRCLPVQRVVDYDGYVRCLVEIGLWKQLQQEVEDGSEEHQGHDSAHVKGQRRMSSRSFNKLVVLALERKTPRLLVEVLRWRGGEMKQYYEVVKELGWVSEVEQLGSYDVEEDDESDYGLCSEAHVQVRQATPVNKCSYEWPTRLMDQKRASVVDFRRFLSDECVYHSILRHSLPPMRVIKFIQQVVERRFLLLSDKLFLDVIISGAPSSASFSASCSKIPTPKSNATVSSNASSNAFALIKYLYRWLKLVVSEIGLGTEERISALPFVLARPHGGGEYRGTVTYRTYRTMLVKLMICTAFVLGWGEVVQFLWSNECASDFKWETGGGDQFFSMAEGPEGGFGRNWGELRNGFLVLNPIVAFPFKGKVDETAIVRLKTPVFLG
eukprot:Nk52_evm20s2085 gene=Nk52_evmTU20s2085